MKKSINIHGISTTATYQEGDCMSLVNLRKKNGVHKPVPPRKTVRTTTEQYVYTFQHNLPQTGENLIGIRNNKLYHVVAVTGQPDTETELTTVSGFKSITQIGNLLQVLDETGLKILWWIDTEYKLIENNFGGGQTATELLPVKVELKVDGISNQDGVREVRTYFGSEFDFNDTSDASSTDNDKLVKNAAYALRTKALSVEHKDGRLTGYLLACTAVELYDGSYVLHSAPILIGPEWDVKRRYEIMAGSNIYKYNTNDVAVFIPSSEPSISNLEDEYGVSNITNFMVREGDYQLEAPHGLEVLTDSFPSFGYLTWANTMGAATWTPSKMKYIQSANFLKYKIYSNIAENLKPLIKSISIFISQQVDPYKETVIRDRVRSGWYKYVLSNDQLYDEMMTYTETYQQTPKTNAEILKELADNQQFYKVHEIPFDDIKTTTDNDGWVTIDLKGKLGDNLIMQEELPVDNFTHHTLLPNAQMVYNSKLHVMDYKQELFHGWPYGYFEQKETGIGQFPTQTRDVTAGGYPHWWVEVKIKTENGIATVVRHKGIQYGTWERNTYANTPMLSYPDSRAYEITLYIARFTLNGTSGFNKTTYKLTPSETHNFAYYISPDLKPITYGITGTPSNTNPSETNSTLIYRNAMKVSSVNNPFYFPPETTFTIGTGVLLNAGTNAQRMSEGQFGQYDLYILTTEGLYSMDTGTEISYNRQSPASLEIPTSSILCATPYGVVFVGKRGLYIINGQQTQLISAQIEENSQANDIYGSSLSFLTYLQTLKDILYDPNQNELIVVSSAHDYNWVLNLESKMWYMSTEKIDFEVKNSSPNLLVVAGKDIKDYSQAQTNSAAVALITRPLYFGIDEVKQLQRAIVRGRIYQMNTLSNSNDLFYRLFGSNDGNNNTLLRGFRMGADKQNRNYKDFDSGLMSRATFRNYAVALEATVDERTEINYIDFEVADNYRNDKLR